MRSARWLFILFQFAWLNVVLPGHTRGALTLPSGDAPKHSCCSAGQATDDAPIDRETPTPGDRARCAICYFAAGMITPPPILSVPLPCGLAQILAVPAPDVAECFHAPLTHYGRAPPAN